MAGAVFDIYFSGKVMEGQDPALVRQRVGALFKANEAQLAALFSGNAVRVKAGVDQETAVKYRVAFRNAGALLEIRPAGGVPAAAPRPAAALERPAPSPAPVTPAARPAAPAGPRPAVAPVGLTLLPPRTGSLIEFAVEEAAAPLPDITALKLGQQGIHLDQRPPEPPLELDLSGLQALPPNSGSLADCVVPEKPAKIPDISRLKVLEPEGTGRRPTVEFSD